MDDREALERLTGAIAQAWSDGCPVAAPERRCELAAAALRRWRSFARRRNSKHPSLDHQIEDIAKCLRDCLEGDRHLVGRLMEDYRYLARVLAHTLVEQTHVAAWEACEAVERDPDKVSGAWVFRGTRVPVAALFENLADGASVEEFLSWFPGADREQVELVLANDQRNTFCRK